MADLADLRSLCGDFLTLTQAQVRTALDNADGDMDIARKRCTQLATPLETRVSQLEAENERLIASNVSLDRRIQALEDMHNQDDAGS